MPSAHDIGLHPVQGLHCHQLDFELFPVQLELLHARLRQRVTGADNRLTLLHRALAFDQQLGDKAVGLGAHLRPVRRPGYAFGQRPQRRRQDEQQADNKTHHYQRNHYRPPAVALQARALE
jgi:hypothetical protein